ncbi:MAG TPA: formate dehydrogenase subunit delta [Steroidobacteraceae bacterium]|nr:formate dehydrogenase subunit delta [Steroidobacteraceae bacterium]
MDVAHLVAMANDIAAFFDAESGQDGAPESVRSHIARYWEPRMRRAIIAHLRERGGDGLCATARSAIEKLAPVA